MVMVIVNIWHSIRCRARINKHCYTEKIYCINVDIMMSFDDETSHASGKHDSMFNIL